DPPCQFERTPQLERDRAGDLSSGEPVRGRGQVPWSACGDLVLEPLGQGSKRRRRRPAALNRPLKLRTQGLKPKGVARVALLKLKAKLRAVDRIARLVARRHGELQTRFGIEIELDPRGIGRRCDRSREQAARLVKGAQ